MPNSNGSSWKLSPNNMRSFTIYAMNMDVICNGKVVGRATLKPQKDPLCNIPIEIVIDDDSLKPLFLPGRRGLSISIRGTNDDKLTCISEITGLPTLRALCDSSSEDSCGEACEIYGNGDGDGNDGCVGCPVQDAVTKLFILEGGKLNEEIR